LGATLKRQQKLCELLWMIPGRCRTVGQQWDGKNKAVFAMSIRSAILIIIPPDFWSFALSISCILTICVTNLLSEEESNSVSEVERERQTVTKWKWVGIDLYIGQVLKPPFPCTINFRLFISSLYALRTHVCKWNETCWNYSSYRSKGLKENDGWDEFNYDIF
jgi:hypothetical protein